MIIASILADPEDEIGLRRIAMVLRGSTLYSYDPATGAEYALECGLDSPDAAYEWLADHYGDDETDYHLHAEGLGPEDGWAN